MKICNNVLILHFKFLTKIIVMRKITIMLAFLLFAGLNFAYAQTKTISGTVSSDNGSGLPGVTVLVKGTTNGTVTDVNGKYSLQVKTSATTLVFSFVGMKTQEIAIDGKTTINVVMKASALSLSQVVVTALGISRKTKALGYAVTTVKPNKLNQEAQPDIIRSLAGKVAGVDITSSSGAPGSSTRITIRGNSSFYGNNQPLFIVDGVPYSNYNFTTSDLNSGGGAYASGISTLDPNDIKSITVLKGAAAAALYGSRASNGVVVIETKSGNAEVKKGIEITISSGFANEEISNLPDYQNTYGAGTNFIYANANGSWGPRFDSQDSIATWPMYKAAFPQMGDSMPYVAQPNNVSSLFRTGHVAENSITITGGTNKTNISMTASLLGNDGYIPNSSFKRKSVNLGGNTILTNGLILNSSFGYTTSTQIGGRFGNNQSSAAGTASSFARTLWLARNWYMQLPYPNPATNANITPNGPGQFDNPLWSWQHNTITTKVDRMVFNVGLHYKITNYLTAKGLFGSNTFFQRRKQIIDIGSRAADGKGSLITDDIRTNEIESTLLLAFNKDLFKGIHLVARVGWSLNQRVIERKSIFGKEFIAANIFTMDNTTNVTPNGSGFSQRRLYGFFYDMSFSFKHYLYLNFTGRNDVSSTLPVKNRSYFYPGFSGSFILSQALGIESDAINFIKLRGSWAKVGNDAGPYLINTIYPLRSGSFPFKGIPGQTVSNTLLDPNLTPEFTKELSFGTDVTLFENRVKFDVTWYNKVTSNQIVTIQIPASSGYDYFHTNAGALQNRGWEVGLNLVPLKFDNGFNWNIYTTFTKNVSKVTQLPAGTKRVILAGLFGDPEPVFEVGQPYGILRGSVDARDSKGNLLINPATGVLIRAKENQTIGDPNPDYLIGVTNSFSYKGLSLNFVVNYTHGGDLYSNSIISMLGRGVTKDTKDREHSYVIPGFYGDPNTGKPLLDANGKEIPNITQVSENDLYFGESFAINGASEWGVYDATVLRLSTISISYDIPKKLLTKIHITGLTITLSGNNLWFYAPHIPKYTNFDPNINGYGNSNVQGIEYSNAPSVRRYGVNLRITL